jgi:peroxiredoxin
LPEINALGATVVAVSPELERHNREAVEKHHLTFDLLSDGGNKVARQLGLVFRLPDDLQQVYKSFGIDLEKYNGDASWELPMPGRFIIDQSGVIRSAEADPDYTIRPEPSETIALLKALQPRPSA